MTSESPFLWHRRVGMRDVDAWRVVWYGNYLVYCDEARAELLRAFDLAPGDFEARGFIAPVIEVTARYASPARYDEELEVHVRLQPPRGTRLAFDFTIRRRKDETLLAQITTTLVLVRTNGDLVYLIPDDIRAAVDRMLTAQPS